MSFYEDLVMQTQRIIPVITVCMRRKNTLSAGGAKTGFLYGTDRDPALGDKGSGTV